LPSFSVRAASIYQINHDASSCHFVAQAGLNGPITPAENHRSFPNLEP
jgi:hypothetical protein